MKTKRRMLQKKDRKRRKKNHQTTTKSLNTRRSNIRLTNSIKRIPRKDRKVGTVVGTNNEVAAGNEAAEGENAAAKAATVVEEAADNSLSTTRSST